MKDLIKETFKVTYVKEGMNQTKKLNLTRRLRRKSQTNSERDSRTRVETI